MELANGRAKLARARHGCPAALADWDEALNDMTLHEARELLEAIDAALRATGDRMEALGLPADRGHGALVLDHQVASDSSDDAVMPPQLGHGGGLPWTGGYPVDMADPAGFQQLQMVPYHGGNNDGLLEQFPREHGFQMQPGCVGDIYLGGGDGMLAPGLANADYNYPGDGDGNGMLAPGLTNAGYNYSGGGDQMLAPGFANAGYNWPDLTVWPADEFCDAAMSHGCYPDFTDCTLAPEHYSAEVATGGDYVSTLPSGYGYPMSMGVGHNFNDLESNYTAAHWQVEAFQRSDTSTSTITGELLSAASSPHYLY